MPPQLRHTDLLSLAACAASLHCDSSCSAESCRASQRAAICRLSACKTELSNSGCCRSYIINWSAFIWLVTLWCSAQHTRWALFTIRAPGMRSERPLFPSGVPPAPTAGHRAPPESAARRSPPRLPSLRAAVPPPRRLPKPAAAPPVAPPAAAARSPLQAQRPCPQAAVSAC